jgi:hypothetical protein
MVGTQMKRVKKSGFMVKQGFGRQMISARLNEDDNQKLEDNKDEHSGVLVYEEQHAHGG